MGIFDGLRRALGGRPDARPVTDNPARVTFSPWTIVGNDIARQYDFYNLGGPGTETNFQIRCTVEKGAAGLLHHHLQFVIHPAIVTQDCYLVALFATTDQAVETGFFPVKVAYLKGDANLLFVESREFASKCLAVLAASNPMEFSVLDKKECLARLPLDNDPSYRKKFTEIQDQVSKL